MTSPSCLGGVYRYGLSRYGLCSYGQYSCGLYSYGLAVGAGVYTYGLCRYGLCSYGQCSYGLAVWASISAKGPRSEPQPHQLQLSSDSGPMWQPRLPTRTTNVGIGASPPHTKKNRRGYGGGSPLDTPTGARAAAPAARTASASRRPARKKKSSGRL